MSTKIRPFDIETGPQSLEAIKAIVGEFDPESVEFGNTKDPAERTEMIEEERRNYDSNLVDGAALDPMLGNVVGIGYQDDDGILIDIDTADERGLLGRFWEKAASRDRGEPLAGWNIVGFDNGFLRMRSWLLNVPMPPDVFSFNTQSGYTNWLGFVDLLHMVRGSKSPSSTSYNLDKVGKAFGLEGKTEKGAKFAKLVRSGDPDELQRAIKYFVGDVTKVNGIGRRVGYRVPENMTVRFEPRSASHGYLAQGQELRLPSKPSEHTPGMGHSPDEPML